MNNLLHRFNRLSTFAATVIDYHPYYPAYSYAAPRIVVSRPLVGRGFVSRGFAHRGGGGGFAHRGRR